MAVTADTHVVGRDYELALLREFVSALAQGPGAMVVRGDAGVGKTTLWRAAVEAARAQAVAVLATRCSEAELPLALTGLADLVEGRLDDVASELAEPQRFELASALGLEPPRDRPADAIALPRAFVAFLRALGRRNRVLVAVDDVQWLDAPSRRVLSFAARRLGGDRVGILTSQRGDDRDPLELAQALGAGRFEELRLGGLTLGALSHLVRTRVDIRISRPLLARVHAASDGNPMFALEFARSLNARRAPAFAPLAVPSSLEELVRDRVSAFDQEVRRLLAVVAAVERLSLSSLQAVEPEAEAALDAAVDAGALVVGDDGVVCVTHPLLASAAYGGLLPSERRALHVRLAAASSDLEERARHLALAWGEPDAGVARLLDEAAIRACARGAPDTAAELAQEAVRVTPAADSSEREERELALATYLFKAGHHADARAQLDTFLASGVAGPRRARAAMLCCDVDHDPKLVAPKLEEALEHVFDDQLLRAYVLLRMSTQELGQHEVPLGREAGREEQGASERLAREAARIAEEIDDPALLAMALSVVAWSAAAGGRPERSLMERALALAEAHGTLPGWPTPRMVMAVDYSLWNGDLQRARELLEVELDVIVREGREYDRVRVLTALAELEWHAGRWERAERHVSDLDELASYGDQTAEAFAMMARGRLAAARGDVDHARHLLAEASGRSEARHMPLVGARWALASLELSLEQPARAYEILAGIGSVSPHITFHLERLHALTDTVEALVGLGDLDRAEQELTGLEALSRENHLWAMPATLRCRALLLLARGNGKAAVDAAQEAADGFGATGFPLDQGRARLVAGEALRRLGERRRAADELEAAKAIFTDLGAAIWAARAGKELGRASPRPRRDGELTNAERRVAALVASGKTNREVASQLFTTVTTVEAHLTRIYRKLDLRSRTELARRVADGTVSLAEE